MINKRFIFWLAVIVLSLVFLFLIRSVLLPFVLGIFIAYFFNPVADWMERTGLPRPLAALTIVTGFFTFIVILSLLVMPAISHQIAGLIDALPGYLADFQHQYQRQLNHWLWRLPASEAENIKSAAANASANVVKMAGNVVTTVLMSAATLVQGAMLVLITPVVAFYLLRDWHDLTRRIDLLLPRQHAPVIRQQLSIIDRTLAGFIRGQLLVCVILAAYYSVGLSLTGLKFGMILGLVTGLLVIFPYVGFLLGLATGLVIALFQFGTVESISIVAAVFFLGSIAESYFLVPKLIGDRVGLHPVWVIFGMFAGGALFGLVGVLLAVPATAIIGVLIRFAIDRYQHSVYYEKT